MTNENRYTYQHSNFPTQRKNRPSIALCMWKNLNMDYSLASRLRHISIYLKKAIHDLSAGSGITGYDACEMVNRIKWILRNNPNGFPGPEMANDILRARRFLSFYISLTYNDDNTERQPTLRELEERGFNEMTFLTTLRQVSAFAAWAYNIDIPKEIQDLLKTTGAKQTDVPEEELSISEDDLACNRSHRFPVVIIIDTGLYMGEDNTLLRVEECLVRLFNEIENSMELSKSIELYVATSGGGPREIVDFAMIDRQALKLDCMMLRPYGQNMMAGTIQMALTKLKSRLSLMRMPDYDINYYKPWMLILSDGRFSGDMKPAFDSINSIPFLQVYARGVSNNARLDALRTLDSGAAVLDDLTGFFKDVFDSLERSQNSIPGGENIQLINKLGFREKT